MRRRCRTTLFLLLGTAALVAGLLSCENNLISPAEAGREAVVLETSVRSGGMLAPGESLDFTLAGNGESGSPEQIEITVKDVGGEVVEKLSVNPNEGASLPSVSFPENEEGLYFVEYVVYGQNGEVIEENEVPVFVAENSPIIERLETYPPTSLGTGAGGVIIPRVTRADNAWLRWTRDGAPLEEGPLSRYREGFVWQAPSVEGVYTIGLEVYPFPPPEEYGDAYDFPSAVTGEVQFYVRGDTPPNPQELRPESSYLHLLHLRGSAEDSGTAEAEFRFINDPGPAVYGDLFGYRLSPGKAIEGDTPLLPVDKNVVDPFSISFIFRLSGSEAIAEGSESGNAEIIKVVGPEGKRYLRLSVRDGGTPLFEIEGLREQAAAPEIDVHRVRELTLSFIPNYAEKSYGETESSEALSEEVARTGGEYRSNFRSGTAAVKWYADGELRRTSIIRYSPSVPPEESRTVIGGENGFVGIVDELGLYFRNEEGRPSSDTGVYVRNMRRREGPASVYLAAGFENGLSPYDGLWISSGSVKRLAILEEEWRDLDLSLVADGSTENAQVVFSDDAGELLSLPLSPPAGDGTVKLHMFRRKNGLTVGVGTEKTAVSDREINGKVRLSIRLAEEADTGLRIGRLHITRSATGLVDER